MSAFLSPCDVRVIDDSTARPWYRLLAPLRYQSDLAGREIVVPAGTETDFASIPMIGMAIVGQPGDRAAVIHDWLIRSGEVDRRMADDVFLEALRACGVDESVAQAMYQAVCIYTAAVMAGDQPPTNWEANV